MFAKKVLISLTLVAAIPAALSRHVSQWGTQVFPDDVVENVPPNNIEDLQIAASDVNPDFESRHNFEEQRGAQNADTDAQDLDIFANEGNTLNNNDAAPDFRDSAIRVNPLNDYPAVANSDVYDPPVFEDNKQEEEPIVPEEQYIPAKRMNARLRSPKIIVVERPDEEQYQNVVDYTEDYRENEIPHGQDNNNDNQIWDNEIMTNEIPNSLKWM